MGENPLVNPYLGPVLVSPMPPEVLKIQNTGFNIFLLVPCGALFGIILTQLTLAYLNWVKNAGSSMKESVPPGFIDDMVGDYTAAMIMALDFIFRSIGALNKIIHTVNRIIIIIE